MKAHFYPGFIKWLQQEENKPLKSLIWKKLLLARSGRFGIHYPIAEGVHEMRVHFGRGYSIYYAYKNPQSLVFLSFGSHDQEYQEIKKAKSCWFDSHSKKHEENIELQEYFIHCLKQPDFTWGLLKSLLVNDTPEGFNIVLSEIVKIEGISHLAKKTGLSRQAIYRIIDYGANPTVQNLNTLLGGLGLQLCVENKGRSAV